MNLTRQLENDELNNYIKEYLVYNQYTNSFECFTAEIKSKQAKQQLTKIMENKSQASTFYENSMQPKLYAMLQTADTKNQREIKAELNHFELKQKYNILLEAARQVFALSIKLVQFIDEKFSNSDQQLSSLVEKYKLAFGKYRKIIVYDGVTPPVEPLTIEQIYSIKDRMMNSLDENNIENVQKDFWELRFNALKVSQDQRKTLVNNLIQADILENQKNKNLNWALNIMELNSFSIKHIFIAFLSIITSNQKGVFYITINKDLTLIEKLLQYLKQQQNGSVTQRFCLAVLQKCSLEEYIIAAYLKEEFIEWILELFTK